MNISINTLFKEYENYSNKEVIIRAFVKTIRSSNKFAFMEINDGTNFKNVQVVLEEDNINNYEQIIKYNIYSGVEIKGIINLTPNMKQDFEIHANKVTLLASCDNDYPLQKKRHTFEYLRTIPHLRPRGNSFNAVFRLRSKMAYGIHEFFQNRDFVYVNTPIITTSDCEGAGEMFKVTTLNDTTKGYEQDFFSKATYLTVSGQLQAESYALAFKNVYTFGPTFRAENSNTKRHAAEFWMVEPEIAFANLEDDMNLAEDMIKYLINKALNECSDEIGFFNKFIDKGLINRLEGIVNSDFARISYTKAIDILEKAKEDFVYPVKWGIDLQTEHERYLTEKHFKKPVFVTDYPKDIKAFYMKMNEDGKTVKAVDLLVPGIGEIIGGSQREEDYNKLSKRMDELGMEKESLDWYMDLRRYGGVEHSGFGLGFERLIMYLSGMENIRDVIPFPRTVKNAKF